MCLFFMYLFPVADNTDLRDGTIIYLKENTENSTVSKFILSGI